MALILPYMDQNPDDPRALFIAGFLFLKSDHPGLAYHVNARTVQVAPDQAIAWHNLGKAANDLQKTEEAEQCFRRALQIDPKLVSSLDGMGLINLNRSEFGLAIEYCNKALKVDPSLMDSKVNRGMSFLALRRWEGWEGYNENIGLNKDRKELKYGEEPRWDGTKGQDIVCYGEQGIGDELCFASCIPDLIRDSAKVTIECDKRLECLFRRSFGGDVFGTRYDAVRPLEGRKFDARVAIGKLPQFYRNKDEDFPKKPFLIPDPQMRIQWKALLDSLGPEMKVGLAWTGGRKNTGKARRSLPLEEFLPILKNRAHFISLQYFDRQEEIDEFQEKHGILVHHWPHGVQSYDYDLTAALVAELDLVISVTTAIVDLSAGLGKECWCLVPEKANWKYPPGDYAWSDKVTLYRQKSTQWPINKLAQMLHDRIAER